jgi:hypothetical protein
MAAFNLAIEPGLLVRDPSSSPPTQFALVWHPDVLVFALKMLGLHDIIHADTAPPDAVGVWFQRNQSVPLGTVGPGKLSINLNDGVGWRPATEVLFLSYLRAKGGYATEVAVAAAIAAAVATYGTAATKDVGVGPGQIPLLDAAGKLPAIDGSQLTNLPSGVNTPFGASGPSHSRGLAPDPGPIAGTTRFLREDGSWIAQIGSPFTGSGPSHAAGSVPDPGAVAGRARYLREDGTWSRPSAVIMSSAGSGLANATVKSAALALVRGSGSFADDYVISTNSVFVAQTGIYRVSFSAIVTVNTSAAGAVGGYGSVVVDGGTQLISGLSVASSQGTATTAFFNCAGLITAAAGSQVSFDTLVSASSFSSATFSPVGFIGMEYVG